MKKLAMLLLFVLLCCGCERDGYFDTGAVMIDKALLPESIEVKDENR
jgi:hypothetical protein